MPKCALSGFHRLSRTRELLVGGVAAVGAAALAFAALPGTDAGHGKAEASAAVQQVKPIALGAAAGSATEPQSATLAKQDGATAAKVKVAAEGATATGEKADTATPAPKATSKAYPDNLDGWIREALAIMAKHNIPGSYEGIYRNIMRESSGNPWAVNNWDINAQSGVPSKGLLQVIQPTFDAYHVPGTSMDLFDPVANIVAACNYAADLYGSMDNVNSAY
jgi:hypothetical protein